MIPRSVRITNSFVDELTKLSARKQRKQLKQKMFDAKREGNKTDGSSNSVYPKGDNYSVGEAGDRDGTDKIMAMGENGATQANDWMNK